MPHLYGPDYSDCARSVRESAALLDRIARCNIVKREELLNIVSYLQTTAMSLEHDDSVVLLGDYRGEISAQTTHAQVTQPQVTQPQVTQPQTTHEVDGDDALLDHLVTWKSLPTEVSTA